MKIFCACLVKDEADIIGQTLTAACRWADLILVYDNGSTDGTWEIVRALAQRHPPIIPYKHDKEIFRDSLRRAPFIEYSKYCNEGDWWCRLDADEIYIDNPREFLASVPSYYQIIWAASLQFYLTDADMCRYEEEPHRYLDDIPVEEKIRYYKSDWSEARFFRYDHKLIWEEGQPFPYAGAVYPQRIRLKHYKQRSPRQAWRRVAVRRAAIAEGSPAFVHERGGEDWCTHVRSAAEMDFDAGDGCYVVHENLMPRLPMTARIPPRLVNALRYWKRYLHRRPRTLRSAG